MEKTKLTKLNEFTLLGFLVLFLFLSFSLNSPLIGIIDENISQFVVSNQINWINNFSVFLSHLFEPVYSIILLSLLGVFLFFKNRKEEAGFLIGVSLISSFFVFTIKNVLMRSRPPIQFLAETGYSFPSGHSLIAIIIFGCLTYFLSKKIKNIWLYSTFSILIIGLSRVYLNVHWFSDIIGGYLLGGIVLLSGILLIDSNIYKRLINPSHPK